MTVSGPLPGASLTFLDRQRECELLDGLLDGVRAGRGGVVVVRGEAGIGKTALLDYAAQSAADLRLIRVAGVESEMELAFAALHQFCSPMLDCLPLLPEPQRDALAISLGLRSGPPPDRFVVGLAVLSLLSEAAGERPLLCLVDDGHWLDRASERALAFAARRLLAEPVLLVIAAREPGADLGGLPALTVEGLPDAEARELLASVVRWPLDDRVRERVLGEARGNPLALRELPRDVSLAELTSDFGPPGALPLADRIEKRFGRQIAELPAATRKLLRVAAACPVGEPARVWRAAQRLGVPEEAATPAVEAGLIEFATWVRFRHPQVRSAAYRSASLDTATTWATREAQYDAVCTWGSPDHAKPQRLNAVEMPVFVANGDSDLMIRPHYSYLIAGLIPQARVKIYPDAAHGFLFQHHVEFAADADDFLTAGSS